MQKEVLKIAIVRLSALGDIIHSASVLPLLFNALGEKYTLQLHWYVDSAFSLILQDSPFIDKIIPLPIKQSLKQRDFKAFLKMYHTLKAESYDIVFDFQGLIKSALITKLLNAKQKIGFNSPKEALAKLFYTQKIKILYKEHILLRNATLALTPFNFEIPPLEQLKNPNAFLGAKACDFSFINNQTQVLFVLETSKANKTYPLDLFLALAKLFNEKNITPLFLTRNKIEIKQTKARFQAVFDLDLDAIKSLLVKMDLIIGGDTGITHLAWALKRPSITLFGATPQQRFNLDTAINHSLSGNLNAQYKKDDFSIKNIAPEAIFTLAENILDSTKGVKCV